MLVGEIMIGHGWVGEAELARALAEQAAAGERICSLLVARGFVAADDAARALGEQHGLPGALQRHLEQRDLDVAARLPAELARGACALPIGTTREGQLVVCVRHPDEADLGALAAAAGVPVVLAVGLASQLERLVAEVFAGVVGDSIDIDLNTGPVDLSDLELVGLDDERVDRDPSQSGDLPGRRR